MRYVIILLSCFIVSCNNSHHTHEQQEQQVEYIEKYCPNCNGVGKVKMSTSAKIALGIITFGHGLLCETETCEICRGTGVIKVRKLNNE